MCTYNSQNVCKGAYFMGTHAIDAERSPLIAGMTSESRGMMKHGVILCEHSVQVYAGGQV